MGIHPALHHNNVADRSHNYIKVLPYQLSYTLPYWQYWSTLGVSSLTAAFLGRFVFMRYNRNANRERYREAVEYIKEAEGRIGDLERREKGKRYKEEEKGSYVP